MMALNVFCVYGPQIQKDKVLQMQSVPGAFPLILLCTDFCALFHADHRHTFHHTHHPLSTHLPLPQRLRKRVHSMDRWRKKKRKKKKTSLPPSDVTPTIHEVDEEEAQSDMDGEGVAATPTETPDIQPQVK